MPMRFRVAVQVQPVMAAYDPAAITAPPFLFSFPRNFLIAYVHELFNYTHMILRSEPFVKRLEKIGAPVAKPAFLPAIISHFARLFKPQFNIFLFRRLVQYLPENLCPRLPVR